MITQVWTRAAITTMSGGIAGSGSAEADTGLWNIGLGVFEEKPAL